MELSYSILIICVLISFLCDGVICDSESLPLPTYGAYLIGFTMLIMLIVIACLSLALYMIKNDKTIFGISLSEKPIYFRQESNQGVTVRNFTSSNNINDTCRNDGSTLTVNSGIVEVGGLSEPETPTYLEQRDENKIPRFKKPKGPIIPSMQKEQMDSIIQEVLQNRKHKSDSATFRELDALTTRPPKINENEHVFKRNSVSLNELDVVDSTDLDESLYENAQIIEKRNEILRKNKDLRVELKMKTLDDTKDNESKISVEDEQEVYDTVPNPIRCSQGDEDDGYVENIHVYDLPPRRNHSKGENSNVVIDHDTDYLLPISKRRSEETTSYINANFRDLHKQ